MAENRQPIRRLDTRRLANIVTKQNGPSGWIPSSFIQQAKALLSRERRRAVLLQTPPAQDSWGRHSWGDGGRRKRGEEVRLPLDSKCFGGLLSLGTEHQQRLTFIFAKHCNETCLSFPFAWACDGFLRCLPLSIEHYLCIGFQLFSRTIFSLIFRTEPRMLWNVPWSIVEVSKFTCFNGNVSPSRPCTQTWQCITKDLAVDHKEIYKPGFNHISFQRVWRHAFKTAFLTTFEHQISLRPLQIGVLGYSEHFKFVKPWPAQSRMTAASGASFSAWPLDKES